MPSAAVAVAAAVLVAGVLLLVVAQDGTRHRGLAAGDRLTMPASCASSPAWAPAVLTKMVWTSGESGLYHFSELG